MSEEDPVERERRRLRTMGWTDRDLDEFVRRNGTAFLYSLPSLPVVLEGDVAGLDRDVLRKVRALLAKAESTTFPEEAEACSAKAQELMSRHRIERLGDVGNGPAGRRIWLDAPYLKPKASLVSAVGRANSCRAVHLVSLGCMHLVGFPDDLESTEVLFTSLLVQAGRAMSAAGPQVDARGRSRTRSFRSSFLEGFAWRVGARLAEANATVTAQATSAQSSLLPVLAKRDEVVEAALREAFPRTARQRPSLSNGAGWAAGITAAERADIGQQRVGGGPTGLPAPKRRAG
jgi:hypothetical protein